MNVKKVTSQMRIEQWMKIISDRNESGFSVREYCSQYNINEATYYYWLKKIRKNLLENSDSKSSNSLVPMIKTLSSQNNLLESKNALRSPNSVVTITTNLMKVEFCSSSSNDLLLQVIRELRNA